MRGLVAVLLASSASACATLPRSVRAPESILALERLGPEADEEAITFFREYLQTDTSNPPGNEALGARLLASKLAAEGIEAELVPLEGTRGRDRASLVARLEGDGSRGGPLCLLSHIDVVPAIASEWTHGPFSGHLDEEGTVWGRGALDMKGMGAIELMTLVWLKRLGVPLGRDVILLAVADEEDQNRGMIELVEHHWGRLGCEYLLNEGGLAIRDLLFEGQTIFPISVAEKGVLWLDLDVRGVGGHGSTPRPEHGPRRFLDVLRRLDRRDPKPRIHSSLFALLDRVGLHRGFPESWVLGSPFLVRHLLLGTLLDNPATRAAITDTVAVTGLDSGGNAHNVVPSQVRARLDCRLLPGTRRGELIEQLSELAGSDAKLSVRFAADALESPTDDPVFDVLVRHAESDRASWVAGPALSPGFTDSLYARQRGAKAYGFVPFEITMELGATYHAANERLSAKELARGLRVLLGATIEISARP
ncbi:MAG: M20/M25/M40 family metallo-hydrolase [Deltaproteobacteria bacterium]|nr:M20/M25/M40 family metallo-hydrolase [Deltaproteobacteria bacterium]